MNKEVRARFDRCTRLPLLRHLLLEFLFKRRSPQMANFTVLFSILVVLLGSVDTADAQWIIEPYPNNTFPIAGSTLSSICIVVWDHRKPPVRVKFQRKAGPLTWKDIPDTDRVYQTNKTEGNKTTATLHFRNVTVEDDLSLGIHRCAVFSSGKMEDRISFSLRVTPREDLPVALVAIVPNRTASFGDKVKLYCHLTHKNNEQTTPIDKVIFLKNGIPVKHTSDVTEPLIFADVTARDGGDYGCLLSVKLHRMQPYNVKATTTAYLHVRVRFPFKESKVVAVLGDSVALECSAEGYPLNVTWHKNKPGSTAIIKPNGRFIIQERCRYCPSILVIQNVTTEDSGNYSCSAGDNTGQQVFLVTVGATSSVASTIMTSHYVTTIFPAFLWIWWPL